MRPYSCYMLCLICSKTCFFCSGVIKPGSINSGLKILVPRVYILCNKNRVLGKNMMIYLEKISKNNTREKKKKGERGNFTVLEGKNIIEENVGWTKISYFGQIFTLGWYLKRR